MKTLFERIAKLPYPVAISIATGVSLLAILPLWLMLVQQKTAMTSRAAEPIITNDTPTPAPQNPYPQQPPTITRIFPWVGKPGDTIWIEGGNFGENPKDSRIAIGEMVLPQDAILAWHDTRIEVILPDAITGASVALRIGTHPIVQSLPLTITTPATPILLTKKDTNLMLTGLSEKISATVFTAAKGKQTLILTPNQMREATLPFSANDIYALLLMDTKNTLLSYRVEPFVLGF